MSSERRIREGALSADKTPTEPPAATRLVPLEPSPRYAVSQEAISAALTAWWAPGRDDPRRAMQAALEQALPALIDRMSLVDLTKVAQRILDLHYPADLKVVCDRDSDDSGPRLTAALRDVLADLERGGRINA